MAGTGFSMDASAFESFLGRMTLTMKNRKALMDAIGETLVSSTQQRFKEGKDPEGKDWEPTKRGGQILVDSAQLKNSITYEASTDMVTVGTNKVYGRIHQEDRDITPKKGPYLKSLTTDGKFMQVEKETIKARPNLGFNDEDKEKIHHLVAKYLNIGSI